MLVTFSGAESEKTVSKVRKRNFCVMFNFFIKQAREIRKFHVEVVQRRLRNVQNSVMHVQKLLSCSVVYYKHIIFAVLLTVAVVVGFVVIQ